MRRRQLRNEQVTMNIARGRLLSALHLPKRRKAPNMSGASEAIHLVAFYRLFAVTKIPLAGQLGPDLCVGIGAHYLAVNDYLCWIGQPMRNGRAGKQRNAESRQDQLCIE
jgi:hypothetical protein